MSNAGAALVSEYISTLLNLLSKAHEFKPTGDIEPALTAQDLGSGIEQLSQLSTSFGARGYAAIETACRKIFYDLLASTSIEDPSFGEVWNLFDIVSIISDSEHCEPGLVFWLVEELLDSQTIDGCRFVFDYLDSRRERITAKHFKQKNLIILRSCNELLRRLSRAEDTVFCGRVFIFLFQSFPLGDKSSVNLRGEYHVENVTTFEKIVPKIAQDDENTMEIDRKKEAEGKIEETSMTQVTSVVEQPNEALEQTNTSAKSVKFESQSEKPQEDGLDMDTLYSIFWSLQETFSQPTRLFDDTNLQVFKEGLQSTIQKFKEVHQELQARGTTKLPEDNKRGVKRKRNGQEDELSSTFNPKYLTSRDLFKLEISDLAFRRHILVQSLILLDFLLSLTPKSKSKLAHTTNKSVLYPYTLSEDNIKWAHYTKTDIANYLRHGPEGLFYYRMVDTVLSRDKNWVVWKAEACPTISLPPISAPDFHEAKNIAQKIGTNKRLRATPLGTLDLKFLADSSGGGDGDGLDKLKHPERYSIPTPESFRGAIAEDEFDVEMAKTAEDKEIAATARASKLWRTLRVARKSRLGLFDKIEDGNNLRALFPSEEEKEMDKEKEKEKEKDEEKEMGKGEGTAEVEANGTVEKAGEQLVEKGVVDTTEQAEKDVDMEVSTKDVETVRLENQQPPSGNTVEVEQEAVVK